MPGEEIPRRDEAAARLEAEALRRSDERFRALVEHSADAIVLLGGDGRFAYASASTLRVLGRPPSDLVGRDAFELMHPDDVERCRGILQYCLEHPGITVRADFRYLHQDGSWRHMEADGVNRLDDPAVQGVAANFRDVTERKNAEEARRRSEERQALLYAVLAAAGAELNADQALRAAVRVMSERTRWKSIHLTVPAEDGLHWKVRACSEGLADVLLPIGPGIVGRAFLTGRTQLVPDVGLDPDYLGVFPNVRSELAVPIRHHGRTLGVLNVESERVADFSAEDARLAESVADAVALALENARLYRTLADEHERLRSLIAATDNGIVLIGAGGAAHVINAPAQRLLGLTRPGDTWLGRPVSELAGRLDAEHAPAAALMESEAQRGPGDESRREGEYQVPGRSVRWSSLPVRTDQAFLGRLIVLSDVTEERRLRGLQEDLTDAVIHDLRGPLTSIGGALGMIEAELGPASRDWSERALRALEQMLAMIDSLLEISRLEQGALPLQRRSLCLSRAVAEAIEGRRPMADRKGVRLEAEAALTLPEAYADPALVARVLDNLVANALRFTPAGGAVRVGVEARDEGLGVTVRDSGPGIRPELQARVFEKFVSGDRGGSGLGLAFCRLVVEAQGGRIWFESRAGQGAAFTFTLPEAGRDPRGAR